MVPEVKLCDEALADGRRQNLRQTNLLPDGVGDEGGVAEVVRHHDRRVQASEVQRRDRLVTLVVAFKNRFLMNRFGDKTGEPISES